MGIISSHSIYRYLQGSPAPTPLTAPSPTTRQNPLSATEWLSLSRSGKEHINSVEMYSDLRLNETSKRLNSSIYIRRAHCNFLFNRPHSVFIDLNISMGSIQMKMSSQTKQEMLYSNVKRIVSLREREATPDGKYWHLSMCPLGVKTRTLRWVLLELSRQHSGPAGGPSY